MPSQSFRNGQTLGQFFEQLYVDDMIMIAMAKSFLEAHIKLADMMATVAQKTVPMFGYFGKTDLA